MVIGAKTICELINVFCLRTVCIFFVKAATCSCEMSPFISKIGLCAVFGNPVFCDHGVLCSLFKRYLICWKVVEISGGSHFLKWLVHNVNNKS